MYVSGINDYVPMIYPFRIPIRYVYICIYIEYTCTYIIYIGAAIAARQRVCLAAFLQLRGGPVPR